MISELGDEQLITGTGIDVPFTFDFNGSQTSLLVWFSPTETPMLLQTLILERLSF